jgi:hypothetical protein
MLCWRASRHVVFPPALRRERRQTGCMTMTQTQADVAAAMNGIEIRAIDPTVLCELRVLDHAGHAPRVITDERGGSPLRCCLRSSRPGERIALVSYAPLRLWAQQNLADPGPYDEVGPVFIHPETCEGPHGTGYPKDFTGTKRMFRAYRADGSILRGRLAAPGELTDEAAASRLLGEIFADPEVAVVHARAVEFGCFTFEIRRATS